MGLGVFDVSKRPAASLSGGRVVKIVELTFDSDYLAGGYALTAATLGLSTVESFICEPTAGFVPEYDHANSKIKVLFGDNNNASDGPLIEVADSANAIDTLKARALVIGTAA